MLFFSDAFYCCKRDKNAKYFFANIAKYAHKYSCSFQNSNVLSFLSSEYVHYVNFSRTSADNFWLFFIGSRKILCLPKVHVFFFIDSSAPNRLFIATRSRELKPINRTSVMSDMSHVRTIKIIYSLYGLKWEPAAVQLNWLSGSGVSCTWKPYSKRWTKSNKLSLYKREHYSVENPWVCP